MRGALSAALAARERGIQNVVVPEANAREAAVVEGIDVFAVKSLPQAVDLVNSPESFQPVPWTLRRCSPKPANIPWTCATFAAKWPPSALSKSPAPAATTFC